MKVAEDIIEDGMTISIGFARAIETLVANNNLTNIIETGTYLGTGTTQAVIDGLLVHNSDCKFFSIEVNPANFRKAVKNLMWFKKVSLINGLSIPKSALPSLVDFTDYPDHIVVDYQPGVREKMYMAEVNFDVKDNMLYECLSAMDFRPDLVILDSAGHIGTVEFDHLMKYVQGDFFLALDDINHVKHYKTVQKINGDGRFKKVWDSDKKFGSIIYKVSIAGSQSTESLVHDSGDIDVKNEITEASE